MSTVGETLRNERIRRGLTIEDVTHALNLSKRYVIAIEDNSYEGIPGKIYTVGFIRNYANFLELNAVELIDQFHRESLSEVETPIDLLAPTQPAISRKIVIIIGMSLVILILIIFLLTQLN